MKDLENAIRRALAALPAYECRDLAAALGVETPRDCDAAFEDCEECARRMADAIVGRMMPEGTEWPRFEDGEFVRIGDSTACALAAMTVSRVVFGSDGFELRGDDCSFVRRDYGERVKRPESTDTQERIDADALKNMLDYWDCAGGNCFDCPSLIDGEIPSHHYGTRSCTDAQTLDLLRRQRELCVRENGSR